MSISIKILYENQWIFYFGFNVNFYTKPMNEWISVWINERILHEWINEFIWMNQYIVVWQRILMCYHYTLRSENVSCVDCFITSFYDEHFQCKLVYDLLLRYGSCCYFDAISGTPMAHSPPAHVMIVCVYESGLGLHV